VTLLGLSIEVYPYEVFLASLFGDPYGVWAGTKFTLQDDPSPSVVAMLILLGSQVLAWIFLIL
jgi:hypothetical protein